MRVPPCWTPDDVPVPSMRATFRRLTSVTDRARVPELVARHGPPIPAQAVRGFPLHLIFTVWILSNGGEVSDPDYLGESAKFGDVSTVSVPGGCTLFTRAAM